MLTIFAMTLMLNPALATDAPATQEAGKISAPAPSLKTVVVGFAAKRDIDKHLADALTQIVVLEFSKKRDDVVGRADMLRLLDLETQKQAVGCDESACLTELADALSAERVISGTITTIGSSYLVELVELQNERVEPLHRIQRQVDKSEDAIAKAVQEMSQTLAQKTKRRKKSLSSGERGEVQINSTPPGSDVIVDGQRLGVTPIHLDVDSGVRELQLIRAGYDRARFTFTVYSKLVTTVDAELVVKREIAETNFNARLQKHRRDDRSHSAWVWTKGIGGVAIGALGGLALYYTPGARDPVGAGIIGGVLVASGVGLVTWAVIDSANPPKVPIPEWEQSRTIVITPPEGQGEPSTITLSPSGADNPGASE